MKKILATLLVCGPISAFAQVGDVSNAPSISYLTFNDVPYGKVKDCYYSPNGFATKPGAVNNNGVVSGSMGVKEGNTCQEHTYLWDNQKNSFNILPLLNPKTTEYPNFKIVASISSSLSSNLVSTGISFAEEDAHLYATFNQYMKPNELKGGNYIIQVSENGQYAVGWNIGGQPTFFNINKNSSIKLTLDGAELNRGAGLYNVSNDGTAVGIVFNDNMNNSAIICKAQSGACSRINVDQTVLSFLPTISSNAKWAYGYTMNNKHIKLFGVNPATLAITPISSQIKQERLKNIYVDAQSTDLGATTVNSSGNSKYLLVPQPNYHGVSLFSITELGKKLSLPSNVNFSTIRLSPNGKYAVFDVDSFDNDRFVAKVYFPKGIENYAINNLTNVNN